MAAKKIRGGRFGLAGSVIAGLLLVPAMAFAAVAIVSSISESEDPVAVAEALPFFSEEDLSAVVADASALENSPADLAEACGEPAAALVASELDESITDLEQAALDALRGICEDAGFSVEGPPLPAPISNSACPPPLNIIGSGHIMPLGDALAIINVAVPFLSS